VSDHQTFEVLKVVMLYAFAQQHHAHQLLVSSVVPDLHEDEDDTIFLLCLLNDQSKTCMVRIIILTIEIFYMTIFSEQRVSHPILVPANRTLQKMQVLFQRGIHHRVGQVGNRGCQPWTPRSLW
jgi:hypothetical protein